MSSGSGGRLEWDLWKLDQEGRVRLARDAWMFETLTPEQPGRLACWRRRVGASLSTLGLRLVRRAPLVASGRGEARGSIAA
jgi:hypothetical protein